MLIYFRVLKKSHFHLSQGTLQRLFNEGTEQYPHNLNKKQYRLPYKNHKQDVLITIFRWNQKQGRIIWTKTGIELSIHIICAQEGLQKCFNAGWEDKGIR